MATSQYNLYSSQHIMYIGIFQERLEDTSKQLSMKIADVKRLEIDMRTAKSTLSKERAQASATRASLQEEASKVSNTSAKQVAEIQAALDKARRDHADGQAQTASLLAAHERRSAKDKREMSEALTTQKRLLQEKVEECSRANSRTVQLEQQLTMALSGQEDLEQQILSLSRRLEAAKMDRRSISKKYKESSGRMSNLIATEENQLRKLTENKMENARLLREVQRLEAALSRKQSRSPQHA